MDLTKWNLDKLKRAIVSELRDACKRGEDPTEQACYQLEEISSGSQGRYQPSDISRYFGMRDPETWEGKKYGQKYDPCDDEWFWEDAESHAASVAILLETACKEDPAFLSELLVPTDRWRLDFGHCEADGSYGMNLFIRDTE